MAKKLNHEQANKESRDSAKYRALVSITRYGNPHGMQLQPWKPEKARGASQGGQWLCENCCKMRSGPKADHKKVCPGFTPYRGGK